MDIIYLLIGIVVGSVISYLLFRNKESVAKAVLSAERDSLKNDIQKAEMRHAKELEALKEERCLDQVKADERHAKELEALAKNYETQLALFREQVTTATERLLKERSSAMQADNKTQMDALIKPINDNISRMERTITENRESAARNSASFEKSIKLMLEQTANLGLQADRLSNALMRKNKIAGNWGELILTELLESQGLQQNVHFDVQATIKDADGNTVYNEDTGKRMVPDVILHLADNRDVVIDSKMSLTAFIDYQNADEDAQRDDAKRRHLESVRAHVRELSAKDYSSYIKGPRVSAGIVLMFVPIEGALQLAFAECPTLWHEAFEKKVFIVGAQTLAAALRIIDLTWVNVQQERNTQLVMDEARKLVDRVNQFYAQFVNVGKKLREANEAYADVVDKVKDGRQSILGSGRNLESLGVRGKKALPGE